MFFLSVFRLSVWIKAQAQASNKDYAAAITSFKSLDIKVHLIGSYIQWNLSTKATLGVKLKWPLQRGGFIEGYI